MKISGKFTKAGKHVMVNHFILQSFISHFITSFLVALSKTEFLANLGKTILTP